MIQEAYASGFVAKISGFEDRQLIQLAEGWTARRLFRGNIRDHYIKVGQHGSLLPEHQHPQVEHVYVISGEIVASVEDDNGEMIETVMEAGMGRIIPGRHRHAFQVVGKGDAILFVAFEPPLSI